MSSDAEKLAAIEATAAAATANFLRTKVSVARDVFKFEALDAESVRVALNTAYGHAEPVILKLHEVSFMTSDGDVVFTSVLDDIPREWFDAIREHAGGSSIVGLSESLTVAIAQSKSGWISAHLLDVANFGAAAVAGSAVSFAARACLSDDRTPSAFAGDAVRACAGVAGATVAAGAVAFMTTTPAGWALFGAKFVGSLAARRLIPTSR